MIQRSVAGVEPISRGAVALAKGYSLAPIRTSLRPCVKGKFLFVGEEKFYVRGVTYGTFRPNAEGDEFPARAVVEADFSQMSANGINAVRTYTPSPPWLLDAAQRHGLRIMVGLPAERSAAFLDYDQCAESLEKMVREKVRYYSGHPAVLCYTIGNEIPASVVRWHGRTKVEDLLKRLYRAAKAEDPDGLVTYVNYPSTEFLLLPFLDFDCFNVYLESQPKFEAYLARLHNAAGARPLVMSELGLDSLRHGEETQAASLDWQVRTAFACGCAGAFVYSWTDQWYRGGAEVEDWKFGVTDRYRQPKSALGTVRAAFCDLPFSPDTNWPRVSVIVCTHNGSRTIRDTLRGLQQLDYPNCEVIVVDDGSDDNTAEIVRGYGFRVISTSHQGLSSARPGEANGKDWAITRPNRGLSNARNLGLEAATGEIVAYIDDDAYPDQDWLTYLVASFLNPRTEKYAGMGGPNLAPPGDGLVADCVAHAPGGPVHVLLSNRKAEHVPGCNMAFRRFALKAIAGFDPQFHVAGDDVDVCWRLQQQGWSLGFSPSAVVWHHRRNSLRAYWKQQKGYGKAEAMLERKWPEKYNAAGHAIWSGRIYSNGMTYTGWRVRRIYHGQWGSAPFQSLYEPVPGMIESLPMLPGWDLIVLGLGGLSLCGLLWRPLLLALPLMVLAATASVVQAVRCAADVEFKMASRWQRWPRRIVTVFLHLVQPLARLFGRTRYGLTFWRRHATTGYAWPRSWTANIWTKECPTSEERLQAIEKNLRKIGWPPVRGGECDRWDLQVSGGILGSARVFLAVEPHGSGRQLLRIRCWPQCSVSAALLAALMAGLGAGAAVDGVTWLWILLEGVSLLVLARMLLECSGAMGAFLAVVRKIEREEKVQEKRGEMS